MMTKEAILNEIMTWSIEDRVALASEIWGSMGVDAPPPALTPQQRADLRRRVAAYRENPDNVVPWDEVKASLGRANL